jgi:predicted acylesterase/phospholipase RssA
MGKRLTERELDRAHAAVNVAQRKPRRALALGGGGPAVGISIGFLLALEEWNAHKLAQGQPQRCIDFPVWVAGCVGGWLACLYHLCGKPQAQNVEIEMRAFFREDDMYEHFPAPKTFTPDIPGQIAEGLKFLLDPQRYKNLVVPEQILQGYHDIRDFYLTRSKWNPGDFAYLMLNSVLAPNPASRLLMSLLYKTDVPGLNKLWFGPDYTLLKKFRLEDLAHQAPDIYINSYNLDRQQSDIYCNHPKPGAVPVKPITMEALCASSALPYVLAPVEIDKETHIEGALIDSFCFEAVHLRHTDLNEVWISQIVCHKQVRKPANLLEALNNLIMLYAGTTSRHDIEIFVNEVNMHELHLAPLVKPKHVAKPIEVFRMPVESSTNYFWSYRNLNDSIRRSKRNCLKFIEHYDAGVADDGQRMPQRRNLFPRARQPW